MLAEAPAQIPITILTGFLGAGKTTLVNRLVGHPGFERSAIIINEIGDVGIDQLLVSKRSVDPVLLAGGCICCTFNKEVGHVLRDLHERRALGLIPFFDRVLIETTGLADPLPILKEIAGDAWIVRHYQPGAVAALVDLATLIAGHALLDEAIAQIAVADRLVLTKSDLFKPNERKAAADYVRSINPQAPMALSTFGDIDPSFFLAKPVAAVCFRALPVSTAADAAHSSGIATVSFTIEGSLDWKQTAETLDRFVKRCGPRLLRLKGVLGIANSTRPVSIHAVQGIFYPPVFLKPSEHNDMSNRIVLIGRNLDLAAITSQLRDDLTACCLVATMEPTA